MSDPPALPECPYSDLPLTVLITSVAAAADWVGVWGVWSGPGLVWMNGGVFAASQFCGGAVCWQQAICLPTQSVVVGEVGRCVGVRWRAGCCEGVLRTDQLQQAIGSTTV